MDAIRLQNYRCFDDTQMIPLKPLTLLLGRNSSGKSSFLRMFPVFRQTFETRTRTPLLWFGRLVDLGTFDDVVRSKSSSNEITVSFKMTNGIAESAVMKTATYQNQGYYRYYWPIIQRSLEVWPVELSASIARDLDAKVDYTSKVSIKVAGHNLTIFASKANHLSKIDINGRDLTKYFAEEMSANVGNLIPILRLRSVEEQPMQSTEVNGNSKKVRLPSVLLTDLVKGLRARIVHGRSRENKAFDLANSFLPNTNESLLRQVKTRSDAGTYWLSHVLQWNENNEDFKFFRDYVLALHLTTLLYVVNERISAEMHNIHYLKPLRATANRYYRFQDLAVDEIDPQGENLPMFINSLPIPDLADFNKWLHGNLGFRVDPEQIGGHVSLHVTEADQSAHNLADSGFGYSQVLPIATQLWWQVKTGTKSNRQLRQKNIDCGFFVVEQPELHLHPCMQAQVADTFVAAISYAKDQNSGIRIVAETHSESIINRIGQLICDKKLNRDDVNIVIFDKEGSSKPCTVTCATYDDQGYLQNWPYGFFSANRI